MKRIAFVLLICCLMISCSSGVNFEVVPLKLRLGVYDSVYHMPDSCFMFFAIKGFDYNQEERDSLEKYFLQLHNTQFNGCPITSYCAFEYKEGVFDSTQELYNFNEINEKAGDGQIILANWKLRDSVEVIHFDGGKYLYGHHYPFEVSDTLHLNNLRD